MPVIFNTPVPRSLFIADASGRIRTEWLNYLARDIPSVLGGTGTVSTLPEIRDIAQSAADVAANAADDAAAAAIAALAADAKAEYAVSRYWVMPKTMTIRAGSGVTVTKDARGYVLSAVGGLSPDDESIVIAGRFFGA